MCVSATKNILNLSIFDKRILPRGQDPFGHSILMSICARHGIKLNDGIILLRLLTH